MDNPRMSERMEALLFASFFATPLHLYVGGGETTPDAGSTTHLALYAASAFVIGTLILSATRNLLSWLNPQAARGSHSGEAAATAAEQRAASRSPSPHHRPVHHTTTVATPAHHRTTAPPTTNSQGALAALPHPRRCRRCHRPRSQLHTYLQERYLHGRLGPELWAGAPLRARTQTQARTRKRRRCEEKEELVCYLVTHAQIIAHTSSPASSPASSVRTVGGACTEARSSMLIGATK